MTIIHEPICQMSPLPSAQAMIAANQQLREELERQMQDFLRRGGKPQILPGPSAHIVIDTPCPETVARTKKIRERASKNVKSATGYLNIRKSKCGMKWRVTFNDFHSPAFDTLAEAIAVRDRAREARGLPKAKK